MNVNLAGNVKKYSSVTELILQIFEIIQTAFCWAKNQHLCIYLKKFKQPYNISNLFQAFALRKQRTSSSSFSSQGRIGALVDEQELLQEPAS